MIEVRALSRFYGEGHVVMMQVDLRPFQITSGIKP